MPKPKKTVLLPRDALTGVRLGISVSESPDLSRLGLVETHLRLALAEIARCVLVAGGHLAYGGHLEPNGYTAFLVHELERYSRRDRPLLVCLAWTEHRKLTLTRLGAERQKLGLLGQLVCLDADGVEINPAAGREGPPQPEKDAAEIQQSLSGMRRFMTRATDGRVLVGGKRQNFQGIIPGILEEAILAAEQEQPLYLAGGFGGVTWDIAHSLGIGRPELFPVLPGAEVDRRVTAGLERLAETLTATKGRSLDNGLSPDEMQRLAVSHRPSEIAALVSLGLGRRFRNKDATA